MPFDELTKNQRQLVIRLIEEMNSGGFSSEFWAIATMGRGWYIQLIGKDDIDDKELDVEFEETDLRELAQAGYITLIPKKTDFAASLKAKAYQQYKLHKDPLNLFSDIQELMSNKTPAIDIFISHSSKDRDVAAALIDLLRAALNVPSEKIRCTSVDGYRLPAGASTDEQLRREIYDAKAFIGLITLTSLQSTYVLFELGARWGARRHLVPALASGADESALRHPLASLNALSCDSPAQVHQLVIDIASSLGISVGSSAAFQKYVAALIEQSKAGRRNNQSQAKAAPKAEASVFTASEEKEFQHIRSMLDKRFKVAFTVNEKKTDDKVSKRLRTEVYETNLLAAVIDLLSKGHDYLEYSQLEIEITKPFRKSHTLESRPDVSLSYGRAVIQEDITTELRRYGLLRHTQRQRFDRQEDAYEFTEKMHRFSYWLEYNGHSYGGLTFEPVSKS